MGCGSAVIHDEGWFVTATASGSFGNPYFIEAKAKAVLEGLQLAVEIDASSIELELDNLALVNLIKTFD